jgi:hypothetical protein
MTKIKKAIKTNTPHFHEPKQFKKPQSNKLQMTSCPSLPSTKEHIKKVLTSAILAENIKKDFTNN